MYLIVGLGNPGNEYKDTKHNAGFWIVDKIAEELNVKVEKKQAKSLVQSAIWEGKKILLAKPQTFMNLSGEAVRELVNYYDNIDNLLIIYDDLDLSVGQLRFKRNGSAGGHNGIKSIIQHLNSTDFERLKIGIGRPRDQRPVRDYVLKPFSKDEKNILEDSIKKAVEGVKLWMTDGISEAMNVINRK